MVDKPRKRSRKERCRGSFGFSLWLVVEYYGLVIDFVYCGQGLELLILLCFTNKSFTITVLILPFSIARAYSFVMQNMFAIEKERCNLTFSPISSATFGLGKEFFSASPFETLMLKEGKRKSQEAWTSEHWQTHNYWENFQGVFFFYPLNLE